MRQSFGSLFDAVRFLRQALLERALGWLSRIINIAGSPD
jgi:hypothetical protein